MLFEFAQQCLNTQSSSINSLFSPHRGENSHRKSGNVQLAPLNCSKPAGPAGEHACAQPLLLALQDRLPKGQRRLRDRHHVAATALATTVAEFWVVIYSLESHTPLRKHKLPFPPSWPQSVIIQSVSCQQLSGRTALGNDLVFLPEEKLKAHRWAVAFCMQVTS